MASSNLPVVTIGQFIKIVEMQIQENDKTPIFGIGKGGIGKSEGIEGLAKRLKLGYIDIRLLLYTESDLKGIPYPDESHVSTIWLQNNILPLAERDGECGILVLDEITSVSKSVRTAAYQLLKERKLGEYKLPDGWFIVCLGNGAEDGGDFLGIEANFANRGGVFEVVTDLSSWKEWAYHNNVNYLVTAYISWRPYHLHTFDPEKPEDILFASPRSWNAVSNILNNQPFNKNDLIMHLRILSNVGIEVGNQFIAFCQYKGSTVDPEDIIKGRQVNDIGNNLEVLFMTMQGVIKLLTDSIKYDKTNHGGIMMETITKCANGVKWMLELKSTEHKVMAIKDFVSIDRPIITQIFLNKDFNKMCPSLMQFANENMGIFKN